MAKGKKKPKSKSFGDQVYNLFMGTKEAKADKPNDGMSDPKPTPKRPDQSIADYIGFPGGEDKPKKKKKKGRR